MKKLLKIVLLTCLIISGEFSFSQTNEDGQSLDNKQFVSKSFVFNLEEQDSDYLGDQQVHEALFTYILLTDLKGSGVPLHSTEQAKTIDPTHYQCEGTITTPNQKIDFEASMTVGQSKQLVIEDQYFDLELGQTILIAPQKDGSLRYLQIRSPGLNSITAPTYVEKLMTKEAVIDFFEQEGNI